MSDLLSSRCKRLDVRRRRLLFRCCHRATQESDMILCMFANGFLKSVGGNIAFTSATLDQGSVDNIMLVLAALDGTNGTTSYDNHNITILRPASPPSQTGLDAKTALEGRGNIVSVSS
jgi:hypothetical protein